MAAPSVVRHDLPFLRRRERPRLAESAAADRSVDAPSTGAGMRTAAVGLELRPAAAAVPASEPSRAAAEHPEPFAAPAVHEVRELGQRTPVLRLDPRQSAIGSLVVSGVSSMVWESSDLITGWAATDGSAGGSHVTTSGNRPLVGFDDDFAIVTLRHVQEFRRAMFFGDAVRPLGVQLYGGSQVAVATTSGPFVFALSILRVGTMLELRAEPLDAGATAESALGDFGFVPTRVVLTRDDTRR
ncbi:hypothetical protein [Herbiconiux liangxiaofengii]|uniref:hypothetical protein n=1 Tax=Herbiconiux liangxiaofengii TaxID=3342795 RepID=UPI0035B82BD6